MTHLFAVLGLAAACALWAVLQRGVADGASGICDEGESDCERCGLPCESARRSALGRSRGRG